MNKKNFLMSLFDGVIQVFVLNLLVEFTISIYSQNIDLTYLFLFAIISALLLATVFYKLILKVPENKVWLFVLNSSFGALLTVALFFINKFTLRFSFFTFREGNAGDGLLLLLIIASFLVASVIFRIIAYVVYNVRKK